MSVGGVGVVTQQMPSRFGPRGSAGRLTSIGRVLHFLGAFAHRDGALTLSELSREAGLSLTTTHRIAKEALDWGAIELGLDGRYRVSNKIVELASGSNRSIEIRNRIIVHLLELYRRTGLTVLLAVRDGEKSLYVESLREQENYSGQNRVGGQLPLHVSASGLVLLAYAHADEQRDYLAKPLRRYTEATISSPGRLREELFRVRSTGYVIAPGYLVPDAGSIAVPVYGGDGAVAAAISLIYFFDRDDPNCLIADIQLAGIRASKALQQHRPPHERTIDFNRRHAGLLA